MKSAKSASKPKAKGTLARASHARRRRLDGTAPKTKSKSNSPPKAATSAASASRLIDQRIRELGSGEARGAGRPSPACGR